MIRPLLFALLFTSTVLASDIRVDQATVQPGASQDDKPAFKEQKPAPSEKELISATSSQPYCSVIAGCAESK